MMKKLSQLLYQIGRKSCKISRITYDIEDLSKGKVNKVVTKNVKRVARKNVHKSLEKFLKKIGL